MSQTSNAHSSKPNMRADKWLWHARFFKTRTLATHFVGNGHLRINGVKQTRASAPLRVGDILVFHLNDHIRMIETLALSTQRGPAPEAQALYLDRDPPKPKAAADKIALREAGSGRPTKKQRRQLDAFFDPKDRP
jgi:ribosome-associated heat shock protein Hsp15